MAIRQMNREEIQEIIAKTGFDYDPLGRIKVISFDLDGCLSDNSFDELVWRTEIPKIYAKENGLDFEEAFRKVTAEYKRLWGKVEGWRSVKFWFSHFGFKTDWQDMIDDIKHHIKYYGDVIPVLKKLKSDYKIIIISHADRLFLDMKLDANGLREFIDESFSTPSDFHEYKKSKEIFNSVCAKLAIENDEIIHVGDSLEYDYNVPMSAGIRSFVIDRIGTDKKEHILRDLHEFESIIYGTQ